MYVCVCWNDAFRKNIVLQSLGVCETVSVFCDSLDFKHLYDLQGWRFYELLAINTNT